MIESKIIGELTLTFVMGGISKKTKNPYLQVSDGVEAKFVSIPKNADIDENTFVNYSRGDEINLQVEIDPFSGRMTLVSVLGS